MWLKQTTVKDVSTLNWAFILHPTCLLWGSAPSFHQRYLISIISIVSESDCLFNTSLKLMPCFRQFCCLSLNTKISKRMTHCSPGKLDNATQLTWPWKPSNIYNATHFSKDFGGWGGMCNLENNIHGKTTFTSFLLRSSQIIGSDEESNENLEFSWGKKI